MSSNTVFVRNLPFNISDDQLKALFADAGPVRKCFVVKDKEPAGGAAASRGFGFVQFALPEDAQRAVSQQHDAVFHGRKLKVELANQRLPLKTRAARKRDGEPEQATHAGSEGTTSSGRLPAKRERATADVGLATKKRRCAGDDGAAEHAQVPLSKPSANASRTVAVGGLAAQKHLGLQLDAAVALARGSGKLCSVTFPCPEEHVQALEQDGCPAQIALLLFETDAAAQTAVAALHGHAAAAGNGSMQRLWARQLGGEGAQVRRWRLIVRNMAFSATEDAIRHLFSSVGFVWDVHVPTLDGGRTRGFAFVAYTCRAHAENAILKLNGAKLAGRAVAVDWALSKRHYDAHLQPSTEDDILAPAAVANGPVADSAAAAADEGALMSQVLASIVQQEDASAAADAAPGDAVPASSLRARRVLASQAAAKIKAVHTAPGAVTLFAHNLSPDSTARDLQLALAGFGRIAACRLVVDKTTGRSKGTAFIEFADAAAAAAALASASVGAGIAVGGRQVQLAAAVSKEDARALGAGKAGHSLAKDRRSLYLAREGEILDGFPAAVGVSEADMEKRRRAAQEKTEKLQNPNFSVSSTRLHFRNLPTSLDEKALRNLCINEVLARTGKRPPVKQARLLRDTCRVNSAGTAASRGMGFVEFLQHEDALAALRAMNNNPTIFGKDRRPIVEFALDDARAARKHDLNLKLRARLKTAAQEAPAESAGGRRREPANGSTLRQPAPQRKRRY